MYNQETATNKMLSAHNTLNEFSFVSHISYRFGFLGPLKLKSISF